MERWKQSIILNKTGQESLFFLYHYPGIMGLPWNHRFVFFWWSIENSWLSSAKLDRNHFSSCKNLFLYHYSGIMGLPWNMGSFSSDWVLKTVDYPQQIQMIIIINCESKVQKIVYPLNEYPHLLEISSFIVIW